MSQRWHIITGEYPPQFGGVSDYTHGVARGLAAAGDEVLVWAPRCEGYSPDDAGVKVHRLPGHFGPLALAELDAALRRQSGRMLLQYTPHAFGCKSMNVPFCAWLWARGRRLDIMFHEVAFPFVPGQPLRHKLLACVHRLMASLVLRAAERVFVSVPGWTSLLRRLAWRFPRPIWLPVPSNFPVVYRADEVARLRANLFAGGNCRIVGHFGTYSPQITRLLDGALPAILDHGPDVCALLLGRGCTDFAREFVQQHPRWAERVLAPGLLEPQTAADHIASCDVMLQPFPDGISTRRTSVMASLALGQAVVSNEGEWTEPIWRASDAVTLANVDSLGPVVLTLLDNLDRRQALCERAAHLYHSQFSLEHTVAVLRAVGRAF